MGHDEEEQGDDHQGHQHHVLVGGGADLLQQVRLQPADQAQRASDQQDARTPEEVIPVIFQGSVETGFQFLDLGFAVRDPLGCLVHFSIGPGVIRFDGFLKLFDLLHIEIRRGSLRRIGCQFE